MIPYKDTSIASKSQQLKKVYINKILTSYNYSIENITANALYDILKNYRKKISNGPLSNGTIKCLLSTIAYYRRDLRQDSVFQNIYKLNKKINNNNNNNNSDFSTLDKNQENFVCDTIAYFVDIFSTIDSANDEEFNILIKNFKINYYTGLAVLLTLITNMRSGELKQITLNNLKQMMNNEAVSIKIKKRQTYLMVLVNCGLLKNIMPSLIRRNRATDGEPLIKVSIVSINKAFRNKLMELMNKTSNDIKYGLHTIRKINTTILIAEDLVEMAQVFNRHKSKDTTIYYYDNKTYIDENQLNKVMKIF